MTLKVAFGCVAVAVACAGCVEVEVGSGREGSRTYEGLPAFDEVDASGGLSNVSIRLCDCSGVRVTGDDNLLDEVRVEVDDGVLELSIDGWVSTTLPIEIQVRSPHLRAIEASGGSAVYAAELYSEALEVNASGGSRVEVDGDLGEVEIDASGGSTVSAIGYAASLRAELSGGSRLRAGSLDTRDADVDASGGSSALVCASDDVRVEASGGSSVTRGCGE